MSSSTGSLLKGALAGAVGTAAMTVHQELRQRLAGDQGESDDDQRADPWESAPAPAQVGKRLIESLLHRRVPASAIPVLTQVMHWSYGTSWGCMYAIARERLDRLDLRLQGPIIGIAVWAASYVQLVPAGIYEPPWRYPLGSLADEIGYHLTYGTTVAFAYEALHR